MSRLTCNVFLCVHVMLLCVTLSSIKAQTPDFLSFDFGKTGETIKVQAMAQDASNHLYYGTSKGLLVYDGLSVKSVSLGDSIEEVSVTALLFHESKLWIGTNSGQLLIWSDGETTIFSDSSFSATAKVNTLKSVGKCVGVATYGEGVYIIADDKIDKHYTTKNGLGDDYSYDLEMHNNRLWIGTDAGITEIDTSENAAFLYSMKNGLPDNIVKSIVPYSDSTIAIGMYDLGICLLNTKSYEFRYPDAEKSWSHGPVEKMLKTSDGILWVATKSDGIVWAEFTQTAQQIRAFSQINGLESNRIQALFQDAEENVWIGTSRGASLYSGSNVEFLTQSEGLPANNIYDVLVDNKGDYWFASEVGVIHYTLNSDGEGLIETYLENDGALDKQIVSLIQSMDGDIWMGSYGGGLFRLDPSTKHIDNYTEEDGLLNPNILDIAEDAEGRLWFATLGGGVLCATPSDEGLQFHQVDENGEFLIEYVYCVFVDNKQQLWVGMDGGGVSVFDCNTETFRDELDGLPEKTGVYSIAQDADGDIWFATDDGGLIEYNQGKAVDHAESAQLAGQSVQSLVVTELGDIVAVYSGGLVVLPVSASQFIKYEVDRDDYEFVPNLNAAFVAHDQVWLGTENGAVKWKRDATFGSGIAPKVSLMGLQVLYEERSMQSEAMFGYNENHFVFEYQAVWLKDPKSVEYQYQLIGFDKDWSYATQSRLATYSSLPPGSYSFQVRASHDGLNWSDPAVSSYDFEIAKPFWMEWWFYLLVFIAMAGGLRIFVRYRTQKLIADKELLEEEVSKRTEEILAQKEIIEVKNEEILSSITYAKRIQTAILPTEQFVKSNLPNAFVLYKPKDIVAGDFYWMTCVRDLTLFAAADCTGHGVPGAMVSVVCSNALNRAVKEIGLTQPSLILDKTRELVIERFNTDNEEAVKDGMDIALCGLNSKTNELYFSGAQNPLWLISSRQEEIIEGITPYTCEQENEKEYFLHEIKPDKQPIGKYAEMSPFTNHKVQLQPGDTFYVFTDGYADQFGGPRGKKYKYKPFKNLLIKMQEKKMDAQHHELDWEFEQWRGELEQVDDVCIIGVRI